MRKVAAPHAEHFEWRCISLSIWSRTTFRWSFGKIALLFSSTNPTSSRLYRSERRIIRATVRGGKCRGTVAALNGNDPLHRARFAALHSDPERRIMVALCYNSVGRLSPRFVTCPPDPDLPRYVVLRSRSLSGWVIGGEGPNSRESSERLRLARCSSTILQTLTWS